MLQQGSQKTNHLDPPIVDLPTHGSFPINDGIRMIHFCKFRTDRKLMLGFEFWCYSNITNT